MGRIGLLSVSASYAGVYPWFYALDLWEMDCWGRSATPILSSQHFSHYVLLIRWVGGTRAWTRDLLIRSPELYRLSYTRASRFNNKNSILTFFQTIGDPIPPSPNAVETSNLRSNNLAPTTCVQLPAWPESGCLFTSNHKEKLTFLKIVSPQLF